MNVLIVSATPFEIAPLENYLREHANAISEGSFKIENTNLRLFVTGVGIPLTSFSLGNLLASQVFDLVVNAGVAGAFNRNLKIGDVVNVVSERFADLGVEEADGSYTDVHELGLIDANQAPFQSGELRNPSSSEFPFLPACKGLTVNKVHGCQASIDAISRKYQADVESMEGAAVFLVCLLAGVPFLEIRAISNYVEPRNRAGWNLPLAIENLNKVLLELLAILNF
jgi:futalosine hydrolase